MVSSRTRVKESKSQQTRPKDHKFVITTGLSGKANFDLLHWLIIEIERVGLGRGYYTWSIQPVRGSNREIVIEGAQSPKF